MKIIFIFAIFSYQCFALQKVDLNLASKEQISLLPGIGDAQAEKIIEARKNSRLRTIADVENIPSMTQKKIANIKDLVVFASVKEKVDKKFINPQKKYPIIELRELESKVVKFLGLDRESEINMHNRLRKSAMLPSITFIADTDKENILTQKKVKNKDDTFLERNGTDMGFGVKATFDLPKLIFNDDEIQLATLFIKRQQERQNIISQVHKHYFSYQQLAEQANKSSSESELFSIYLKMNVDKAFLDSYSENLFSKFIDDNLSK